MTLKIVFMGSPEFAVPSLRALAEKYSVVGVVTQPARAAGRGNAIKAAAVQVLAQALNLPLLQPEKLRAPEAMTQLRAWNPDLIVVAAYGQILKQDVLDLPAHGCINVHASLLPRWRGAAPINYAILAGDEETGVTLMKMDAGLDTGAMIAQRMLPISRDLTTGAASLSLSQLGADLLKQTLPDYLDGKITPRLQPSEGVTYAPTLSKKDGLLDFTRPAAELERRVRAMNPWPGAWFEWDGKLLNVARASVSVETAGESGERLIVQGRPALQTSNGILILEEVQPAGKKWMSAKSFLAGARTWSAQKA